MPLDLQQKQIALQKIYKPYLEGFDKARNEKNFEAFDEHKKLIEKALAATQNRSWLADLAVRDIDLYTDLTENNDNLPKVKEVEQFISEMVSHRVDRTKRELGITPAFTKYVKKSSFTDNLNHTARKTPEIKKELKFKPQLVEKNTLGGMPLSDEDKFFSISSFENKIIKIDYISEIMKGFASNPYLQRNMLKESQELTAEGILENYSDSEKNKVEESLSYSFQKRTLIMEDIKGLDPELFDRSEEDMGSINKLEANLQQKFQERSKFSHSPSRR